MEVTTVKESRNSCKTCNICRPTIKASITEEGIGCRSDDELLEFYQRQSEGFQEQMLIPEKSWGYIETDIADMITYCPDYGTPEKTLASMKALEDSVDQYLLRYYMLGIELDETKDCFVAMENCLQGRIDSYFKLPREKRKQLIDPLPEKRNGNYGFAKFAVAAKKDLLCKSLSEYKNATKKSSSLNHLGVFFSEKMYPRKCKEQNTESYPAKLPPFQLEDYIYYELRTRASFAIEVCAALLDIKDKNIREICQNEVKARLQHILEHPGILAPIFLIRKCIYEAKFAVEAAPYQVSYAQKYINSAESLLTNTQLKLCAEVVSSVFENVLAAPNSMPPYYGPCKMDAGKMRSCRENVAKIISGIKSPVDIMNYVNATKDDTAGMYGPIAFCNPKHPNINEYLAELEMLNKGIDYTSENKYWKLFSEIYQATVTAIPKIPLAPPTWKEYYKT